MKQRLLLFFFAISLAVGTFNYITQTGQKTLPLAPAPPVYKHKILLLPLDSRPPCQKFVIDAGQITGIEVISPPAEILDYYTQKGDTAALRLWLSENIKNADAAILSLDQLIYGGLLAARENSGDSAAESAAMQFLSELKAANPQVSLYAFNILPRIQPPASIDQYEQRKALIKTSRLSEELAIFDNPLDLAEIRQSNEKLPPATQEKYRNLYKKNTKLNEKLSQMTQQGVLTRLVIGQDDSEDFGIPNMEKQQIQRYLQTANISADTVTITRGADEVALSLLTEIQTRIFQIYSPKIHVVYNDAAAPGRLMPYMSASVATTVQEKIRLMHGQIVDSPEDADFILFVHIGTDKNLAARAQSVKRLQEFLKQDCKIALVDLSQHFSAEETLLPMLLQYDFPINRLIAYAGWNTTSNAVGTAVAQATLFSSELSQCHNREELLALYKSNLTFLNNRYLEDYFYLKDLIDSVNANLKKAGYTNVYDLDMEHNYRWANDMLQTGMNKRADYFKHSYAYRQPLAFKTPSGPMQLRIKDLQVEASYPWPRTFEIHLQTRLELEELP